ncbi:MAG: HIT domain-containing protein [Thermodesulfobacteriota bacterium]|jgi:ATP adenylyltransferase|nr:HIT domain-containing protein [Candidatus Dadabacteria bacterium]MCZ6528692.1 HIT domain-containing protein [Candidatus Dadabacteria bacterium]MCZ6556102.1 HIT domain-containing protein [Candidatus Dadabacteria bacterium]MCZ6638492.1 HIT domain-containing protein [Candidatus Dadabacteria bacterium]MCZ6684630.1 HIT domain-containing protein [Candidatus Dadabacteria bacterium]
MKTLWAPWRIEYITGGKKEGCIFCDKPKEGNDKKNLILYKGETSFIIMNRYPYSNGHLMAVPYRHINNMSELDHKERLELMNLTTKCIEILKVMNPDGFNIGMNLGTAGGAGIDDHLHFHIVPRWNGDTNFMPLIADVKVMPEYLEDTYETLSEQLKNN